MRHYATVCRQEQLPVLLASMRRHCGDFRLHILAWDFPPFQLGPGTLVESRENFLDRHPEYAQMPGPPRSPIDTVATVRWQFFHDVMGWTQTPITTLDGDMWFWSSPEPMFEEIGAAPMAVSPHRIPQRSRGSLGVSFESHRMFGLFNAGLTYWADPAPLLKMADMTWDWSYTMVRTHPVDGLPDFGDQGALERVAFRRGAHVIAHPGVNLAPWNVHGHLVIPGEPPTVDGRPLIVYHYSSYRDGKQLANPEYQVSAFHAAHLYAPYVFAVDEAARSTAAGGA